MPLRFALAGNPNCGKTTLFNELTGSSAHVGNWPGVTIDRKEGRVRRLAEEAVVVDLPGIYSLSPYTPEEVVSREYLVKEKPDAIINIVDATNLARNLYLTTQLMELDLPVVIALNMSDEVRKQGNAIDEAALSGLLGVPVVSISALKGQGLAALLDAAVKAAREGRHGYNILDSSLAGPEINAVRERLDAINYPSAHFHAVKLLERDTLASADPALAADMPAIESARQRTEAALPPGENIESAIAGLRYRWIAAHAQSLVERRKPGLLENASDRIDRALTHRYLGVPFFFGFMFLMFHLTFGERLLGIPDIPGPGVWLQGLTGSLIDGFGGWLGGMLEAWNAAPWARGLLIDGVIGGVGAVLSFLPQIMLLFLFLSILEDSGYMARAAYLMDRLLRKVGLSGRAFLPMLTGFGCSVPALMGTRTLENEKDRRLTRILIPYMSCGAKAPIWAVFSAALFPQSADLVVFGIYLLGILVAVASALILKRTLLRQEAAPLIIELPPYRLPKPRNSVILMWEKLKEYVTRAGTVILCATIAIWFLSSFNWSLGMVDSGGADSILGGVGRAIRWIFVPLGFAGGPDGWKAAVAILTGLLAKEAVVSSLGVLYNPGLGDALGDEGAQGALLASLASAFTPLAALSYMAFNLLTIPCMAAVAAMRAETRSARWTAITLGIWAGTAWGVSFLIYNVGKLLGF